MVFNLFETLIQVLVELFGHNLHHIVVFAKFVSHLRFLDECNFVVQKSALSRPWCSQLPPPSHLEGSGALLRNCSLDFALQVGCILNLLLEGKLVLERLRLGLRLLGLKTDSGILQGLSTGLGFCQRITESRSVFVHVVASISLYLTG